MPCSHVYPALSILPANSLEESESAGYRPPDEPILPGLRLISGGQEFASSITFAGEPLLDDHYRMVGVDDAGPRNPAETAYEPPASAVGSLDLGACTPP